MNTLAGAKKNQKFKAHFRLNQNSTLCYNRNDSNAFTQSKSKVNIQGSDLSGIESKQTLPQNINQNS